MNKKTLTIDLGNTSTHIIFWENKEIIAETRIFTDKTNIEDYKLKLLTFVSSFHYKNAYISSVVPVCEAVLLEIIPEAQFIKYDQVQQFNFSLMEGDVSGIGADRLAAMIAVASDEINIIFDMGTATNIEVLKGNCYQGGLILPGFEITIEALINRASLLQQLKSEYDKPILLGKNLNQQIFGAHLQAQVLTIEGFMKQYLEEFKEVNFYLTGGFSENISKYITIKHTHDPYLVHKGLIKLYEK